MKLQLGFCVKAVDYTRASFETRWPPRLECVAKPTNKLEAAATYVWGRMRVFLAKVNVGSRTFRGRLRDRLDEELTS